MKKPWCHRIARLRWENWRRLFRFWVLVGCCWFSVQAAAMVLAQDPGSVSVTIKLRSGDGSAIIDEPVILQRLPDFEPALPACRTDDKGYCTWQVMPGLYQLQFDRPLDEISALALAEGGLSGLGITVGETPITYHITFHSDGRAYFDAAPEAIVPQPIIPIGQMLQGGVLEPTPIATDAFPEPAPEATAATAAETPSVTVETPRHLLFYVGGGVLIGLVLYLWSTDPLKTWLGMADAKGETHRD